MKILYGVQGTGNGHVSRARVMSRHLRAMGADVTYLFSGRPRKQYFDMEDFGDYLCMRGFTLAYDSGKLQYLKTWLNNDIRQFITDIRSLDLSSYDIVITDYEPITAWAARWQEKQSIGIGHQYAFSYRVPMEGNNPASRWLLGNFAPARVKLGLHWSDFGQEILPPIVNTSLRRTPQPEGAPRKILVYLPFENQADTTRLLSAIDNHEFYQYSSEFTDSEQGHVKLRKTCLDGFKQDLSSSAGVICNAGFELVSEAIHLGLQMLVKPLHGQAEQLSNAHALTELNLGTRLDSLTVGGICDWLDSFEENPPQASGAYPDVAEAICKWIVEGDWRDPGHLSGQLWSHCRPHNSLYSSLSRMGLQAPT